MLQLRLLLVVVVLVMGFGTGRWLAVVAVDAVCTVTRGAGP